MVEFGAEIFILRIENQGIGWFLTVVGLNVLVKN